jgi:hypothetical protein
MIIFKFKTGVRRFVTKRLRLDRPTSHPFISGDGFRALAQHIFDEISDFDPRNVEENDIIFVRNDFLKDFFTTKHPKIKNKYILISTNDDTNISSEYEKYIDDKIIHWFTSALLFKNDKVTPIPLGVTNYHYNYLGRGKVSALYKSTNEPKSKINKMCYGFAAASTATERVQLKKLLIENNLADNIETKNQSTYYQKMSSYKFTICPDGRAIDAHRTWEALYLRVIPIVKSSLLVKYFKSIGIPLLIVENWNQLKDFNEEFLSKKYAELEKDFENSAIHIDYWTKLVLKKRLM